MEIAKALVLAGSGTDDGGPAWPSVRSIPKPLVPVGNTPILFHQLQSLRRAGVLEATIATRARDAAAIRAAVGNGSAWNMVVRYARSDSAPHLHHVLAGTREFLGDEPVLVQRADALLRGRMHQHIVAFAGEGLDALALRVRADSPDSGWLLSPRAVDILADPARTPEDPLARVRERGGHVREQGVDGCLSCHGSQETLLEANRRVLEDLSASYLASSLSASELQGPVVVHPTARLERTVVRGPAIIGAHARLVDSYVGPYTSVGPDVKLDGVEIEHSIVLHGARMEFLGARVESSVIGPGAHLRRAFAMPQHAMRFSIGEGAEVVLS